MSMLNGALSLVGLAGSGAGGGPSGSGGKRGRTYPVSLVGSEDTHLPGGGYTVADIETTSPSPPPSSLGIGNSSGNWNYQTSFAPPVTMGLGSGARSGVGSGPSTPMTPNSGYSNATTATLTGASTSRAGAGSGASGSYIPFAIDHPYASSSVGHEPVAGSRDSYGVSNRNQGGVIGERGTYYEVGNIFYILAQFFSYQSYL
jgi:hypothetical protein